MMEASEKEAGLLIKGLCKREVLKLIERIPNEIEWLHQGAAGAWVPLRNVELVDGKVRLS
jgi:hypothetical protein